MVLQNINDIFDRSVHPLYAVAAFVGAIVILVLILNSRANNFKAKIKPHEVLFIWMTFFCIQDGVWGLFASHIIQNDTLLLITSYIFHLSAAATTVFWMEYMIRLLKDNLKIPRFFRWLTIGLFLVQFGLIVANIFKPGFLFYVDEDGWYRTTDYRTILFYIQFFVYIVIFVGSLIAIIFDKNRKNTKFMSAYIVNLAPFLFSLFQMWYPDAPADSLGFTVGCVVIHTFLVRDYEKEIAYLEEKEKMQGELEVALEKAQQSDIAKTTFLFNMSHDIRTPLNAILGFSHIIENHVNDPDKITDSINKIKLSSTQLLNLINDVLEMSRIESGKMEITPQPTSLNELLNGVNTVLKCLAIDKSIDYVVSVDNIQNCFVNVDASKLTSVIINLVSNAIKYTLMGGKVYFTAEQISTEEGTATYRFTIKDTGIGMSHEFMEHMFEQFSRARTTTVSKIQGTGLGLAITKRIIDAFGGTIEVSSEENVGSTFVVTIPMQTIEPFASTEEEIEEINNTVSLDGLKVLVVDDNEMNREIAIYILESEGMIVEAAEDGENAIKRIQERGMDYFDIVFMDIQMPVMNGYEAAQKIRELPDGDKLLIIALSANAFKEDKQKSIESGMDDHIAKPINLKELLLTLKKHKPSIKK